MRVSARRFYLSPTLASIKAIHATDHQLC
jgi:hypothetical protein